MQPLTQRTLRTAVLLLLTLGAWPGSAAPLSTAAHAEAVILLQALQKSGCQFNRNGSWYNCTEAQAHLTKKLDYLEGKGLIHTTEEFIQAGASTSSMSGQPYLVRCGTAQPVESKTWLLEQLKVVRQGK